MLRKGPEKQRETWKVWRRICTYLVLQKSQNSHGRLSLTCLFQGNHFFFDIFNAICGPTSLAPCLFHVHVKTMVLSMCCECVFFSSFHWFRFEIRHAMVCRSGACQATISVVKTGMDEVTCRVLRDWSMKPFAGWARKPVMAKINRCFLFSQILTFWTVALGSGSIIKHHCELTSKWPFHGEPVAQLPGAEGFSGETKAHRWRSRPGFWQFQIKLMTTLFG